MANARLDRDIPCIKCKYNLRGLDADGMCPECGASIAWTRKQGRRRRRRQNTCTKLFAIVFPLLYVLWVIGWFAIAQVSGGEQGFMSIAALAPIWAILKALGFAPIGGSLMCLMLFPVGPLVYAVMGAVVGYLFDLVIYAIVRRS